MFPKNFTSGVIPHSASDSITTTPKVQRTRSESSIGSLRDVSSRETSALFGASDSITTTAKVQRSLSERSIGSLRDVSSREISALFGVSDPITTTAKVQRTRSESSVGSLRNPFSRETSTLIGASDSITTTAKVQRTRSESSIGSLRDVSSREISALFGVSDPITTTAEVSIDSLSDNPFEAKWFYVEKRKECTVDLSKPLLLQAPLPSMEDETWSNFLIIILSRLKNNNLFSHALVLNGKWEDLFKYIANSVGGYWNTHGVKGYDKLASIVEKIEKIINTRLYPPEVAEVRYTLKLLKLYEKYVPTNSNGHCCFDDNVLNIVDSIHEIPLSEAEKNQLCSEAIKSIECFIKNTFGSFASHLSNIEQPQVAFFLFPKYCKDNKVKLMEMKAFYTKLSKYSNLEKSFNAEDMVCKINQLINKYTYYIHYSECGSLLPELLKIARDTCSSKSEILQCLHTRLSDALEAHSLAVSDKDEFSFISKFVQDYIINCCEESIEIFNNSALECNFNVGEPKKISTLSESIIITMNKMKLIFNSIS